MGEGQAAAGARPGAGGGPADHLLHAGDAIQRYDFKVFMRKQLTTL